MTQAGSNSAGRHRQAERPLARMRPPGARDRNGALSPPKGPLPSRSPRSLVAILDAFIEPGGDRLGPYAADHEAAGASLCSRLIERNPADELGEPAKGLRDISCHGKERKKAEACTLCAGRGEGMAMVFVETWS